MKPTYYVTTPIYYVTAKPHLGSLYSTVLADIFARWHRGQGCEARMVTGTDEHGQKVAEAAAVAGKTPQAFVDSFIPAFEQTWKRYGIDYATFIRTTDAGHQRAVVAWIEQLMRQGDIYRGEYVGFYCTPCETFVPEREQEGPAEHPTCPSCQRATQKVTENCYFFKLSAYQDRLLTYYEQHPDFIVPKERLHEVISFVRSGLKDLAISRSKATVSWGIPFPGDDTQVVYVWADALNNYISAIGYGDPQRVDEFARWWPAQMHILGKDIVRFHAVYWPAFLMAAGLPLPDKLLVHGWIQVNGAKMSKSLGNVVDPEALARHFGVDAVRYYIARHFAITQDVPFSLEDMVTRINADLADDLGNLVQRVTTLACARNVHTIVIGHRVHQDDAQLYHAVRTLTRAAHEAFEGCMLHRGLAEIWRAIAEINSYVHAQSPWKLPSTEQTRFGEIIATALDALMLLMPYIMPVMPHAMAQVVERLGLRPDEAIMHAQTRLHDDAYTYTLTVQKGSPLFPKVLMPVDENSAAQQPVEKKSSTGPEITIDLFANVDLRVGTITAVDIVPKSEKLYKLTVDAGPLGIRTICSGVRAHFTPDELLHKQGLFVANLPARAMMGIPSQGMMLFVENEEGKLVLVGPGAAVPAGGRAR